MDTEDFVTFEQALALKKLGFKEKCDYIYRFENNPLYSLEERIIRKEYCVSWNNYRDCCSAPTLAQAQKWLHKNKRYYIEITYDELIYSYNYRIIRMGLKVLYKGNKNYNSPEEVLSAGITECLKLLNK